MQLRKLIVLVAVVLLGAVAAASAATLKNYPGADGKPDPISGKYEGVAKSEQMGDIPLTVELKNDNGKLSGKIDTPQGPAAITGGTFADGKITMKFDAGGNEGTVTATVNGDKISGKWELGGQGGALELKRAGAAVAATPTTMAPAAGGDPISGEWDASADAAGTTIPFTLKLKFDGTKVTGTSDSSQGSATISKGSYAANKLTITLDTEQGAITLTGMLKEGKLTGDFDFAGQMQGKWEAKKK